MANVNDRIFKENFFINFLPIIEKIFGLEHIETTREITEKLQHTMEREPDFVRIVETEKGEQYILHLEFQTTNDKHMLLRMGEYHSLLMRRYDLPIKHFVLYFGNSKPTMKTQLPADKVFRGFELKDMKDYKSSDFLRSESPEEVVMSILANFEGAKPGDVIERTLLRLQELTADASLLSKYAEQLMILSGLRKLSNETEQKVKAMAITIDIENNAFYKEGKREGKLEGLQEGKLEGLQEGKLEIAKQMLVSGRYSVAEIASITGLSASTIERLQSAKKGK